MPGRYFAVGADGKKLVMTDDMRENLTSDLGYDPQTLSRPLGASSLQEWCERAAAKCES